MKEYKFTHILQWLIPYTSTKFTVIIQASTRPGESCWIPKKVSTLKKDKTGRVSNFCTNFKIPIRIKYTSPTQMPFSKRRRLSWAGGRANCWASSGRAGCAAWPACLSSCAAALWRCPLLGHLCFGSGRASASSQQGQNWILLMSF